jgi:F-box and leucine-rich repeat protein 2/20
MTIVHLSGITPNGLIAALMACGGLRKVKLNAALKSMMHPHMLRSVEAWGCIFQWMNKPYKALYLFLSACMFSLIQSNPCVHQHF